MSMVGDGQLGAAPGPAAPYIHWGAVVAGAFTAAATAFVLLTFAGALGLSVASGFNTWRDATIPLMILAGVWLLVVSVGANALGGYIAGRMRPQWALTHDDEVEFRDGAHGLVVWALALLISAALTFAAAAPFAAGGAGAAASRSATGEAAATAFEVDRLFRSDRRATDGGEAERAEAGRILTAAAAREPMAEDRAQLVRLVSARTGLAQPDAERRVDASLTRVRDAAVKARRSAILMGFVTAAAFAIGAATAWFAAGIGGRHRDTANPPSFGVRRVRVVVADR